MRVYLVGGAVRDSLLGLEVRDRDWVVVGADEETMVRLGFQPVGKDFPVFLHPKTREEYALARTERKTAKGYTGFVFHTDKAISLEQDLLRRDLTINAIAQTQDGRIIDPYGGRHDLENKILRHVSDAFAEDPVRILRTARFAARYGFSVAPETMRLMRKMVADGEADALVPERVWQEFAKGLMEKHPERMMRVLYESGILKVILPESDRPDAPILQQCADNGLDLCGRYAAMMYGLAPADVRNINLRWRIPKQCAELAELVAVWHGALDRIGSLHPAEILNVLKRTDALRRPGRFLTALDVCTANAQTHGSAYRQRDAWPAALDAANGIDTAQIAAEHQGRAREIAAAIDQARLSQIETAMPLIHNPE